MTNNKYVLSWIDEMAAMTQPDKIVWIDGSDEQAEALRAEACSTGELIKLNQELLPNCYLHRTAVNDVARVEGRTFICTPTQEEAGNINNWMDPNEMYAKLKKLYTGAMKGRTMYVIPYSMGVVGSDFAKYGIELTDSIYVVLNMLIMTRVGNNVLEALGDSPDYIKGLHAKADLDEENRYIVHFPQDNTIMSVNSGYGGNVLLGKKCFALRIASYLGRKEGWMAEHMLILGLEYPDGEIKYISAAFPSACGKTNLAMLIPPEYFRKKGYKVWCVGDDIAWLRVGKDGRLWAVNPENGFFGVAPGTSMKTNPNAMLSCSKNTIFTNVALTDDGDVWWEGMTKEPPAHLIDWHGNDWTPESGTPAAHPNSRFAAPIANCPCIDENADKLEGVPISAIVIGGRRPKGIPLVFESFNWTHGVYLGAMMGSERTAAAEGKQGELRSDPMAMLPFAGYNMANYLGHLVKMGKNLEKTPRFYHVNWFRRDAEGNFMWPGFGANARVLAWIVNRQNGEAKAKETAIGFVPEYDDLDWDGMEYSKDTFKELMTYDPATVSAQPLSEELFELLPHSLKVEREALLERLS